MSQWIGLHICNRLILPRLTFSPWGLSELYKVHFCLAMDFQMSSNQNIYNKNLCLQMGSNSVLYSLEELLHRPGSWSAELKFAWHCTYNLRDACHNVIGPKNFSALTIKRLKKKTQLSPPACSLALAPCTVKCSMATLAKFTSGFGK